MTMPLHGPAGICVSIASEDIKQAVDIARSAETFADIVEIRLDTLSDPKIEPFVKNLVNKTLYNTRILFSLLLSLPQSPQRISRRRYSGFSV